MRPAAQHRSPTILQLQRVLQVFVLGDFLPVHLQLQREIPDGPDEVWEERGTSVQTRLLIFCLLGCCFHLDVLCQLQHVPGELAKEAGTSALNTAAPPAREHLALCEHWWSLFGDRGQPGPTRRREKSPGDTEQVPGHHWEVSSPHTRIWDVGSLWPPGREQGASRVPPPKGYCRLSRACWSMVPLLL